MGYSDWCTRKTFRWRNICGKYDFSYDLNKEFEVLPMIKKLERSLLTDYRNFKCEDLKPLIEEWGGNIEKDRAYIPFRKIRMFQYLERTWGARGILDYLWNSNGLRCYSAEWGCCKTWQNSWLHGGYVKKLRRRDGKSAKRRNYKFNV